MSLNKHVTPILLCIGPCYLFRSIIKTNNPINEMFPSILQGCYPYEVKACDHHVVGKLDPCSGDGPTPRCKKECESGYNVTYKADKHYGKNCV